MAKGFKHGGDGFDALNFEVVGGTTARTNPKENTVWIHTDTEMTGWCFSCGEPAEPEAGMVWIKTVANAACAGQFNAVRRNGVIEVYPQSAYQYEDGAWVGKSAQIYKNGDWVDWDLWVFKSGAGMMEGFSGFSNTTYNADRITGTLSDDKDMVSKETVDVTAYSTAHFSGVTAECSCGDANTSSLYAFVGDTKTKIGSSNANGTVSYCMDAEFTVDLSQIEGEVSFGIEASSNGGATFPVKVTDIWFL